MSCTASLLGAGWGPWQGTWSSAARLEGGVSGWSLVRDERVEGSWDSFREAVAELWSGRSLFGPDPWAVGWSGYEELAAHAGGLPARPGSDAFPYGWWLLEPRRSSQGSSPESGQAGAGSVVTSSLGDEAFCAGVRQIRERIAAGDVYQVNLTRRFRVEPWQGGLSRVLEAAADGGAPEYLSWFSVARGELVCASMELLLRRRGEVVETRPIKGTRPRGRTPEEDQALRCALADDAKELAELAMVVDLERNDLGQVARAGSVRVVDPGSVHTYASVHHRVARVSARVDAGLPWWELLAAVAPGGSVTGCPKRSAMELVSELEPVPRGPYTGALGVVAGNGDLELALPIRTAWKNGSRLDFAAGCGVVWQSDPAREQEESRIKVARWLDLEDRR